MAYIDFIYGTKAQALELKAFLKKWKGKYAKRIDVEDMPDTDDIIRIASFPVTVDKLIYQKSKLVWAKERLRFMYGNKHKQWDRSTNND